MERLRGKTILIGKEQGQGRLLISVNINGQNKTGAIGMPGSVPSCVSRCKPVDGSAHCKIVIDQSGNMILTNLKPQNVTYVNGVEIESKRINLTETVLLGKDRYGINLEEVITAATKIVATVIKEPVREYSIKHLERVWNIYHDKSIAIKKRQRQINLMRSMPMIFTLGSGAIGGVAAHFFQDIGWIPIITGCLFGFGLLLMIYGFYLSTTDKSIEENEMITDEFQMHYICPNFKCRHFMGMQPYKILRQNKKCPYCGCLLTEK